jgi:serine phosphatase RsbU (regulator of sigma subunit)
MIDVSPNSPPISLQAVRTQHVGRTDVPDVAALHRNYRFAILVLLTGLLITAALAWTSFSLNERNETRLLRLDVKQAGSVLSVVLPVIQTPLASAAAIAATTDGNPQKFKSYITSYVGPKGPFVSASLWQLNGPRPRPIAVVGSALHLAANPAKASAFFGRVRQIRTLNVIGLLAGSRPRLGYAFIPVGNTPRYAVYAESTLPPNRQAVVQNDSAFSDLNFAVYLGRSARPDALLESTRTPLPITGHTATTTVPFGDSAFTMVATPTGQLGGTLSEWLPWIIAIFGTLLALIVALTAERLVRHRREAEHLAGENRRLYGEQRTISETLQHSLLPQELPSISGVEIAIRYIPGVDGIDVGGDWYDVIPVEDDHFIFVVGDVSGRGLRAATVMASLHYAIRAYALEGHPPTTILDKLSPMLRVGRDGHFATVLCGLVDLGRREVTLANAGHLPPLLLNGESGDYVSTHVGPPIGVTTPTPYASVTFSTPRNATLIAFTDGLVERRGETLDVGFQRLVEATRGVDGSLNDLLAKVVAELGAAFDDDTAIIGMRWID